MEVSESEELSRVIGHVYDCVIAPERWTLAIEQLTRFVGGSSALLFHQDRAQQSGDFIYSFNADPEWTKRYFDHYIRINPVLPFTVFMDVGDCAALSTFIDLDEFKRSQFYIEWAEPQDFLDVVVTMLAKDATSMGMFAVTRFESEGPAGEQQLRRMALVTPHLRRAVMIQRMFSAIQGGAKAFLSAIDALPSAVFLLAQDLAVLFANVAGRELAEGGGVLSISGGKLAMRDPEPARRLMSAMKNGHGERRASNLQPEFTLNGKNGTRLAGHILPLSENNRREVGQERAIAALFIRRVEAYSPPPMQAFAEHYGFTPRELQVFNGIVQFGGVPEVARIYGLSSTTVRTHLQNIFDKTGVRRQADLARLVAGLAPPPAKAPR